MRSKAATKPKRHHAKLDALAERELKGFLEDAKSFLLTGDVPTKASTPPPNPSAVRQTAHVAFAEMLKLAEHDPVAASELCDMTCIALSTLTRMALTTADSFMLAGLVKALHDGAADLEFAYNKNPKPFGDLPTRYTAWPVCSSTHPGRKRQLDELFKGMGLGSNTAMKPGRWQVGTQLDVTVQRMRQLIEWARSRNRIWHWSEMEKLKLPEWVRQAIALPENADPETLFEVGWLALMDATNNKPEDPRFGLYLIGAYRKNYDNKSGKEGTIAAQVRAGIRDALRNAFLARYAR